jgi:hypothetical protein
MYIFIDHIAWSEKSWKQSNLPTSLDTGLPRDVHLVCPRLPLTTFVMLQHNTH